MSVLRAILGRFARLLVRIARTLDSGVAASPNWAASERMAVLRQRYPGAPEHWLQLLSRQPLGAPPPPPADLSPGEARPEADSHRSRGAEAGRGARPALRFPNLLHRPRPAVTAASSTSRSRYDPVLRIDTPRSLRPPLTFGFPRLRNPFATLLRREQAVPHQGGHNDRGSERSPTKNDRSEGDRFAVFDRPEAQAATRADWPALHPSDRSAATPAWPEFRFSAPPGPSWPSPAPGAGRDNPQFPAAGAYWPELPRLLDEADAPLLSASDEAALRAEQLGGTWSA